MIRTAIRIRQWALHRGFSRGEFQLLWWERCITWPCEQIIDAAEMWRLRHGFRHLRKMNAQARKYAKENAALLRELEAMAAPPPSQEDT